MARKNFKAAVDAKKSTRAAVTQIDPSGIDEPVPHTPTPKPETTAPREKVAKLKTPIKTEDTPKHYSTYIYKSQQKKIKMHALNDEVKDQKIVQKALDEYFESHPL
jgi:hypothetical protein